MLYQHEKHLRLLTNVDNVNDCDSVQCLFNPIQRFFAHVKCSLTFSNVFQWDSYFLTLELCGLWFPLNYLGFNSKD